MSVEIELKFEIQKERIPSYLERLAKIDFAVTTRRTLEKTVMFDNQEKLMQLTNGRVRLRVSKQGGDLSYKKPLGQKTIKKEVEHEITVSNAQTTKEILNKMGFRPTTSYERYRTTLKNQEGSLKVTIDEFPFATFIEIETSRSETAIRKLAKLLGLKLGQSLTQPCDTLFRKWREAHGLPPKPHLRFNSYDK